MGLIDDKKQNKQKITKFAVILSQLRKERGISQKKAATDLGISQALLSHYEKGIRECGLDFVIKCSEYYGVTTDYLLGVSESRNGFNTDYMNESSSADDGTKSIATLSKATKYLFDIASAATSVEARDYLYDYYMLSVYRGAITLAKAGVLPKEMFKIDYTIGRELVSAAIAVQDAKFVFIEDKSRTGGYDANKPTPLNDLIEEAEEHILSGFVF
jgi:transcriptional regulator with XRE-family HTH domain